MKLPDFLTRCDQLVQHADRVFRTRRQDQWGHDFVDEGSFSGFRAAVLSFLQNLFGKDHSYYTVFDKRCSENKTDMLRSGREILMAVRAELEGGWFATTKGLVSAEIFADFIEMATFLVAEKYKDAGAVIVGSVLEEHLRQLCLKNGIEVSFEKNGVVVQKKADRLNGDLAGAQVYNKLEQKSVTAWLDLRNKAAHGKYDEYGQQQVELMLQGVTDFMARNAV